jgi:hypothetical protein
MLHRDKMELLKCVRNDMQERITATEYIVYDSGKIKNDLNRCELKSEKVGFLSLQFSLLRVCYLLVHHYFKPY